jgi:hypothetical protein
LKKKKDDLEAALLHTRESVAGIEKIARRYWNKEKSRTVLRVIREAAVRTVKLIGLALKKAREKDG